MYVPKGVPKRVQNPPRGRKSPGKQANPRLRIDQKGCKNGPQKRNQNSAQKWTLTGPQNERKLDFTIQAPRHTSLRIPKHGKRGVENHAKGGYHAPLSNATGKHFHFFGACISVFPDGINWRSAVLSRGSRRDQKRFHQAGVGKTANSLLKDGAKIHLKNERKIIRPKGLKSRPKSTSR